MLTSTQLSRFSNLTKLCHDTIMIAVMDVTMTTYVTMSLMNVDSVMLIMRIMMKMHIFDNGEHPVFVSLC